MSSQSHTERTILEVTGEERISFLQGLVSNDVSRIKDGLVYAALLSPQGKYLADFFLLERETAILVDVAAPLAPDLLKRLSLYKLRAQVELRETTMPVVRGVGPIPPGAYSDPRHTSLGWRLYGTAEEAPSTDWDEIRVAACIPETGIELIPNETYILEAGFERLNGVDFRKGCYVGQEVTARMKHKTELRKGLAQVSIEGAAPVGTQILAEAKPVGTLFTQSKGKAIAYLRFDRAKEDMRAENAIIRFVST